MGKPTWGHAQVPPPEHIGRVEATGGTETSKYPEEQKSTEIPLVVASERGRAQTHVCVSRQALLHVGLWESGSHGCRRAAELQNVVVAERLGTAGHRG
jgi:hypothetical protein